MKYTKTPPSQSDLGSRPIGPLFWHYAIPSIAAMLVNGIYTLIDGIFIGQIVGAEGLASLNFAWPIHGTILGIGIMIGMGTGTWMSILQGQGDYQTPRRYIGNAILLIIFLGLLFPVILLPIQESLLGLMGASGNTQTLAHSYLWVLNIASMAALAGTALPLMIRNDERPHLTTLIMVFGAVLNIILDWLFIMVLDLGVTGAALGTVLAQCSVGLLGIIYFLSPLANARISIVDLLFSWVYSVKILSAGLPSLLMFLFYGFMLAIHNRLLINYGGVIAVGAFAIVGYIQGAFYLFSEGVSSAMQPLISFNHGAKNYHRLLATLHIGLKTLFIAGISSVILINLFPEVIANIFNNDDMVLQKVTLTALRLHLFAMFFDGFIVLAAVWFQSMAKSKIASWITVGNFIIQIPLLIILPYFLGITGVWITLPVSTMILSIPVAWVLLMDMRKLKLLSPDKTTQNSAC
ncbi:MAG: MATE family efflux transporter [Endozoicomonadaceae bacterium]|nr:MATE family efflux transporter [Endozoicomonadaceae bacterium]